MNSNSTYQLAKPGQVIYALCASVSSTADTKIKWVNIHEAFGTANGYSNHYIICVKLSTEFFTLGYGEKVGMRLEAEDSA